MTEEQAQRLAEFIKDHDKRFVAKARPNGPESDVLLTLASDGTTLEPVTDIDAYRQAQIEQDDPGLTVRAAWEKWQAQNYGG